MSKVIKLRKGLDIKIKGRAETVVETLQFPKTIAIKPTDFPGLTPKMIVKQDFDVNVGDPLFYDKYHPDVVFTAPVGGKVISINRGERRRILEVVIEINQDTETKKFKTGTADTLSRDEIKEQLLKSGLWPFIKRRPYNLIARPDEQPKSVFISTFDTSPLAPDYNFILEDQLATFQAGVDIVAKLTETKIYLGVTENSIFTNIKNVEIVNVSGIHPAGNVGIQIHHIDPINKGEVVWTIDPQDLLFIGRLFETGEIDLTKTIALTGSEVEQPKYLQTIVGAPIDILVSEKLKSTDYKQRIISGNVLTGTRVTVDSYLGFYCNQVTVIPEGDEYELLGWATPGINKFSASNTFLSGLFPKKEYQLNANMHGGERAFVMTDQYSKVLPMNLYPVFLLKAIIANDLDKMEQLGIYEVVEEDLALCEFVCTSKIKVQQILRSGMNVVMKELG